jgi:hypothetical protein
MTERKSPDFHRPSVKRGAKLISRSSKLSSSSVVTPPKAAVAAPNAKNDELHRRRNPFNDILKHGNMGVENAGHAGPSSVSQEPSNASVRPQPSADGIDIRMAHRVAELERALAVAKEEQDALREDLAKVKEQRQTDQDTIEHLEQQLDHTYRSAPRTPSRASSGHWRDSEDDADEDAIRQNHELCYKLAERQEQLACEDALHHNNLERPSSREESEDLRFRLHTAEKEGQERLQQLLSLKSSISSLTRLDPQVTDGDLTESFSQLANRIREWTISNFRRSKVELSNIPPDTRTVLRSITPDYENLLAQDRLALFQAIVANILMQVFQEPIVVGIPSVGPLAGIRSIAEKLQEPGFSEYSEWRRATIRLLESCSEQKEDIQQKRKHLLLESAGEVRQLLGTLTSVVLTSDAHDALLVIVSTAIELQRTLAMQRARYDVVFFRGTRTAFDDRYMETINDVEGNVDENSDMGIDQTFLFCVFPGLLKFGDEWGQHPEISNVLLKARVCSGVGNT